MATTTKIIIRLCDGMSEESKILERYNSLPKTRRQEFLRNMLLAGFESISATESEPLDTPTNAFVSEPALKPKGASRLAGSMG